jgi:phenylalanyl-tRNA synthetase beta chain
MNILIPHTWLLEHLETDVDPKTLQKHISLCGPSVERIYEREGESVYDIEVTTNRVDSMSVRGIAREAAVILKQAGYAAELKPLSQPHTLTTLKPTGTALPLPEVRNNPKLNKRTICVILKNVKRTPTPDWMAKRLLQTEMNVHDSVIDITNYITHELGHPCHAFDYDKLMKTGGIIDIVEAKKGETFTTLDGNTFETVGGEVVFKNGEGVIIDLPSIKGTANTSIDDSTHNVLLLMESIDAKKVRFASMTHAIRTVAAQLMEKHVDPNLAEPTLLRGVELYLELCGAELGSEVYDEFSGQRTPTAVTLSEATLRQYLGLEIASADVITILEMLECSVIHDPAAATYSVTPPTFRPDLTIPADIVEEIARIYGYHNLPSVIMDTKLPLKRPTGTNFGLEHRIKQFLADTGWQEVFTYSMVSAEIATQSGYSIDQHLHLKNPLTDDREYLRRSLVPSLQEVLTQNPNHHQLSVFELAYVYEPQGTQLPLQQLQLTLVTSTSYQELKGAVEALLAQFFVTAHVVPNTNPITGFQTSGDIVVDDVQVGSIGVTSKGASAGVITTYAAVVSVEALLAVVKKHPTYQPLPKTAAIMEDLTFTLLPQTQVGPVMESIKATSSLVTNVTLKDVYQSNYTFSITYLDPEQNLSSVDVAPVRKEIVAQLQKRHSAELIGALA